MATKRIYLVTDTEDPFPLSENSLDDARGRRVQAQTLAKDCREMQFMIHPFFVVHNGDADFDVTKFFADFLVHHIELVQEDVGKFTVREDNDDDHGWGHFFAVSSVNPPPKRSAFSIPFILGDGLEISISGCDLLTE
jgi:hypothetical protein